MTSALYFLASMAGPAMYVYKVKPTPPHPRRLRFLMRRLIVRTERGSDGLR